MNWWLIAGIVVGVIAAIVAVVMFLKYIYNLLSEFDLEDKCYMEAFTDEDYVSVGRDAFIFSIILGIIVGIYNLINIFGHGGIQAMCSRTEEYNIFFIMIFIALLLYTTVQAVLACDTTRGTLTKAFLGIYYTLIGLIAGAMLSVILVILLVVVAIQSGGFATNSTRKYTLEDGTVVEEEEDIINTFMGTRNNRLKEVGGTRRFRRDGDMATEE